MEKIIEKDIAIIGAGPTGIFTVFEAGMLGYSSVVVDSLEEIGGQLSALYPEKPIYDIPGYPTILAKELVDKLVEQAAPFDPVYILNEQADNLQKEGDTFTFQAGDTTIKAKVVVIAAGGGMFVPRKPPMENIAEFEDKTVFYAVRDKSRFKDRIVTIAGGGDSAADWAVELAADAKQIHIIHRRAEFRAAEETVKQLHALEKEGKIIIHTPCQLHQLHGENGQLNKITIADLDQNTSEFETDDLLCFFGIAPNLGPLANWDLELKARKIIVNPETMQSSKEGILAVGDIASYPAKISLILTGFAEAAIATKTAQAIINPEKKFKVVYSTSKGVPDS